jgi:hypothetical protein
LRGIGGALGAGAGGATGATAHPAASSTIATLAPVRRASGCTLGGRVVATMIDPIETVDGVEF